MRGLYLHIPFCVRKCHYCNFVTTAQTAPDVRERFFSALRREIQAVTIRYGRLVFDTLYLGGGTPSLLTPDEMSGLLREVREAFDFHPGCEITCEMNPGTVDGEKAEAYHCLGINRISLGAQAFQDRLLAGMGRIHRVRDIHETMSLLKKSGFSNISLDLILKLPGQSAEDFESSLREAVLLEPVQLTLYDLDVHEKTVYGSLMEKGKLLLPDEDCHRRMFDFAEKFLPEAGYLPYELFSFSKPGLESRHNLIYWHNEEYLGLGPGAFSYLDGVRYQLAAGIPQYFRKCESGDWTRETEDVLSDEQKEVETLITGLRLREGVDLGRFQMIRRFAEEKAAVLAEAGFIERDGDRIRLTQSGRAMAERVLAEFIL